MGIVLELDSQPRQERGTPRSMDHASQRLLAFLDKALREISEPVAALWCALELAALRAEDPEEDRQDLLAAFAMAEDLGKRLREIQDSFKSVCAHPLGERLGIEK